MQDWRLIALTLLVAGLLSALVKYVLPQWVQQPQPWLVWGLVLGPACAVALTLLWRGGKL
jgi:FtsH-binding integral membrane protein